MASSSSPVKSVAPSAATPSNELDLFGADSEASDDEATIARYAIEHELKEEDEGKTVSALTSKVRPRISLSSVRLLDSFTCCVGSFHQKSSLSSTTRTDPVPFQSMNSLPW